MSESFTAASNGGVAMDQLADVATQVHVAARISDSEPTPDQAPEERHWRTLGPCARGASDLRRPRHPLSGH
ncbi:hypothetical protein [Leptospirillum ferriphilum]|uniref:hypothetical protein n=1 Tax=Leptospirillum ferriphilum TaxID=178606 RepID=UPI001939DC4C|nr:hypothetical protein [Leptospirillum ferriphilum]